MECMEQGAFIVDWIAKPHLSVRPSSLTDHNYFMAPWLLEEYSNTHYNYKHWPQININRSIAIPLPGFMIIH